MDGERWPLIAQGSVARQSEIYWDRVCERVTEVIPNVDPIVPQLPPGLILAYLGITSTSDADPDRVRQALQEGLEPGEAGKTHERG